ncbi:TonB-dependent receptor [Psychroflexus sp. YR1-1]|uniref:TonB-dependent receptor n=1 Tax=Psychroflexus aurantiacus TaxID=2709310 RepID=A0A6B3R0U0_9FLAO|nr:TonB-dependent receptor [Psychroflexus aurantiacus]NEV94179.1 TonB-dependent receptor [Psychroflexus aurantiacus]
MEINQKSFIFFLFGILMFSQGFAQRDTISTDKLIIIKQYSPTVNDAFKIKQKPSVKDTIKQKRKAVSYSFVDVPVASTFTPAKGTASGVRMAPPQKKYENYARFGAGNYSTILADFYSNFNLNPDRNIDVQFSHLSSQGGIEDVVLDDDFSNTLLGLNLTSKDRDFDWNSGIELNHREVNYYGVSDDLVSQIPEQEFSSIDPKQTYTKLAALGGIQFHDSFLKEGEVLIQNFTDDYSSSEQLLALSSRVEIPLGYEILSLNGDFRFLNGTFQTAFYDTNEINYQQFQAGLNPFVDLTFDNLNLKLGARAVFFNDFEAGSSEVFFYPDVEAEIFLNQESLKINLGVKGGLTQNTYENFSSENPFVSPTLLIRPSDQQYKAFAGFSAKLLSDLSLSAEASYSSTKDYALFKANPNLDNSSASRRNFDYGNSFDVVYSDLEIASISADLAFQADSDFTLGLYGRYSNFSTEADEEAWNLPELELKAYANYDFTKNWNFSASLFYIGERKDAFENVLIASNGLPISSGQTTVSIDGFLDLNASVEYRIIPRLSAFVNARNLLNNAYNRWQNYEVQGLQVTGGMIYQFDW